MRSRRRKTSLARQVFLWGSCLALVGWGLYWADQLRRMLPDPVRMDMPAVAVSAAEDPSVPEPAAEEPGPVAVGLLPELSPEALAGEGEDGIEALAPVGIPSYPTFDAALSAEELFSRGSQMLERGEIVAGRFALNASLARCGEDGEARAAQIRTVLAGLNGTVFLGSAVLPEDPAARLIDIQEDDTFGKIAHTYGVPVGLLPMLNPSLNANNLKPQTGIKIVQGPFHARVVKHDQRLDLYARDQYVKSFPVIFPEGNFLPRGNYQISAATKLQLGAGAAARAWIGFHGVEAGTEQVASGWIYGSAGPRGNTTRDLATGMQLSDGDMRMMYVTLTEGRSHVRVEP